METGAALNDLSGMYRSLKGIFEPDALLCCVDADTNVQQHKNEGVGVVFLKQLHPWK